MMGTSITVAQNNAATDSIVAEGKLLYRSEMASWYGTDVFMERFKEHHNNIGGYFSYTESGVSKCVFYSKAAVPDVLATISFDSTYNTATATVDSKSRSFTAYEHDLYRIRDNAMNLVKTDSLFERYNNTNFNLIPVISGGQKKVYVLTGTNQSGIVILGNDYLLTYSGNNELLRKQKLHKNISPVKYGKEAASGNGKPTGAMHSHLPETGDYITATDICTLMLYEGFAKWEQHIVVSGKYMNIWNCKEDKLTVIPRPK